jgi:hypothetical protein
MTESVSDERGKLYLGREYDLENGTITERPVLYDLRHLTTHGVILGMTGSGKTGLGVVLLEEALLQSIPVLILDPKGDIANLLLTFPDLSPADFARWVDVEGARRRGMSVEAYAAEEARRWREGLAQWSITGERIARLRQAAQFTLFTPGSEAGQPVDVLHFFDPPDLDWDTHEEALRERVGGIVSALLELVGVEADPLQSPQHILLARIVEHVWRLGEPLDLPRLIQLLQKPPFQQVGVFELETFFPEKERFTLARALNNLIAAPGFENWQEGTPLDVGTLLLASDGRPRASIFYLAHLDDAQRSFFITLFLEAVRDWLRAQSGTTDLRALLYFDEVFGYFPPYPSNPPTKRPLMALIKQGRAAGLGVVLATQNPADLDYKGLTNAGTWAVGALRAERDKERVLEGLEGAVAEAGSALDRHTLDRALGALRPRVFLLHDVHEGRPIFFHTRWAMSYLRGPLTREQVREVAEGQGDKETTVRRRRGAGGGRPHGAGVVEARRGRAAVELGDWGAEEWGGRGAEEEVERLGELGATPPALPPDLPQVFLPPTITFEWALRGHEEQVGQPVLVRERRLVYAPYLLALATVRVLDQARGVSHQEVVARLVRPEVGPLGLNWDEGEVTVGEADLSPKPLGAGAYMPVSPALARLRDLKRWESDFADYVYRRANVTIWYNPALKLYGKAGESRRDFRVRCEEQARHGRDVELKEARARMAKEMARVQAALRREQRELAGDQEELEARKREELLTLGESALNLLTGRRTSYMISYASRRRTMTRKAKAEVEESEAAIEDLEEQLATLGEEWQAQAAEINERWATTLEKVEQVQIAPRRADVMVGFCGLAWVPSWQVMLEDGQRVDLPARGSD